MRIDILKRGKGWPVQACGIPRGVNPKSYAAWYRNSGFPEESPDFSVHDVFDMLEFCIEKQLYADSANK